MKFFFEVENFYAPSVPCSLIVNQFFLTPLRVSTGEKSDIIFHKNEVVRLPEADYHRHDISDKIWELLKPHLPGVDNGAE